jgi:hypothetical protein
MSINEYRSRRLRHDQGDPTAPERGACMDAEGTCRPQLLPTVLRSSGTTIPLAVNH